MKWRAIWRYLLWSLKLWGTWCLPKHKFRHTIFCLLQTPIFETLVAINVSQKVCKCENVMEFSKFIIWWSCFLQVSVKGFLPPEWSFDKPWYSNYKISENCGWRWLNFESYIVRLFSKSLLLITLIIWWPIK